ncbi:MAG TPA: SprB repeat-containing protein, partial [Cytophagaceae bacterium]|nr:SprB repeat-containing protein [Cytophagaceae bacterium]
MRQYLILFALLILFFNSSLQAQNTTVSDNSGRWKLGFNMGAAWQHGDVRALPGLGGGITLEWALVQNNHSALGLSIRGRYLSATTFGKDLVKDSINYLNNPFLNGTNDPNMNYTSQGGVYQNYKTKLTEWTFEGMIIANRLRAKHGILLYGFGGIGTTIFRVSVDQKNDATGQIYNYGTSKTLTQSQLNTLRDGKYETEIIKPQFALSPSFGIGLGFMLGKRVSFGFEHKLTFPTTDRLDGVVASNHNKYYGNHDMYHYTSANLTFTLGKGRSSGYTPYSNTNNYYQNNTYQNTTVQPPYFNTSRPTDNPHYATDCRANILADIENINSIYDIEVYMNGTRLSPSHYFYNPTTKIFNLDIAISQTVAFSVIAKNSAGTASKDYTFVCTAPNNNTTPLMAQPEIIIYNPTVNPSNAANCYADIYGKISNIDGMNNIEVRQNNQLISSTLYNYNTYSKEFRLNTQINGNTTFTITATNIAGRAISSVAFYCQPPVIINNNVPQYITICHIPPGDPSHPVTITIDQSMLQSYLANGDHLGACAVVNTTNSCAGFSATVVSQNNISCNGGNNGSINITASGGTMPYSYTWSNGAASQDISNLTAGTYAVTVRDMNGCTTAANATVTQPSKLTVDAFSTSTCAGSNTGTATASVGGGTSPYRYLWTNMLASQSINNLSPGIYNVTITDARNCSANASVSVNQSSSLHLTVNTVNASCQGGSNGSVNLTATGGTAPYLYNWSNGSKAQDINNLQTGSYTVTVTDSKNCSGTATALVSDPEKLTVTSGVNGNSASVSANGGTAPYTYIWSNGVSGANQNNLANGNYTVTVTDVNKCTAFAPVVINYTPVPNCNGFAASIASQINVKCNGGNNGSINLNVSGGTTPYKYSWNNGASSQDLSNLTAGTYSVTVMDANSCKATASGIITQPAALAVSASGTSTCPGGATGSATVSVTGGNSPYTYKWDNGGSEQTISNL